MSTDSKKKAKKILALLNGKMRDKVIKRTEKNIELGAMAGLSAETVGRFRSEKIDLGYINLLSLAIATGESSESFHKLAYEAQANIPVTETNIPVAKANIPVTETNIPVTEANIPVTGINIPVTGINIPVTGTNIPVTETNIPVTGINHRKHKKKKQSTINH